MHKLEVEIINKSSDNKDVEKLYRDSFPKEERIEYNKLFAGVFADFVMYAFYCDKQLVGMAHINNTPEFVHINYLAVDKNCRSQGFGSQVLLWIKQQFNKAMVLDCEEPSGSESFEDDILRRKRFYLKNNFVDGEFTFMWHNYYMTYMHAGDVECDKFKKYIVGIFPDITDIKYR